MADHPPAPPAGTSVDREIGSGRRPQTNRRIPGTVATEPPLHSFALPNHMERAMTTITEPDNKWPRAFAAVALLALALQGQAVFAQGTASETAVDKIIGTEVQEEEARAEAEPEKVIAAIEKTAESTETVRKVSKLDKVDIVFLSDSAKTEGGPPPEIAAQIERHKDEIAQLREELQGNAMLYHAIDSRQLLVDDVLAVTFDDADGVVIYAAAKPPAR